MGNDESVEKSKIVVTGATGLIGGRIVELLLEAGHVIFVLARNEGKVRKRFGDSVEWIAWDCDSSATGDWVAALEGCRAVFHLAGTPLFARRWSPEFLREVADSRVKSSHTLVEAMRSVKLRPKVLVSASAIGFYGSDSELDATEEHEAADDVLAKMCVPWESACRDAESLGVRSVQIRVGIVLSPDSGALKEMLPPFRLGVGGVLGKPDPWINWIHIDDIARVFLHAMKNEELHGPVNGVAPSPVTNAEFAKTLAKTIKRPCLFRVPTAFLRLALGQAADFLSGGARVRPALLEKSGFDFLFTSLEPALADLLVSNH